VPIRATARARRAAARASAGTSKNQTDIGELAVIATV